MESAEVTALATVFIAVLALGATAWQASLTREHNRKSTRPFLVLHSGQVGGTYLFEAHNEGVGPAFIVKFTFYIDRKREDAKAFYDKVFEGQGFEADVTTIVPPSCLGPGKNVTIVRVPILEGRETELATLLSRCEVQISYDSVYDIHYETGYERMGIG